MTDTVAGTGTSDAGGAPYAFPKLARSGIAAVYEQIEQGERELVAPRLSKRDYDLGTATWDLRAANPEQLASTPLEPRESTRQDGPWRRCQRWNMTLPGRAR